MFQDISNTNFEEKMLWVGVLWRAVSDYVLYKGKRQFELRWRKAHRYIFEDAEYGDRLSFNEVCEILDWEPDYIRRIIKSMDRDDVSKLKSSKFREDYRDDTALPSTTGEARWIAADLKVPLFRRFMYSRDYREVLTPRKVLRSLGAPTPPMVAWNAA